MSDIQDNIFRDGTSQKKRYNSGPEPEKVPIDGRDMEYLLRYLVKLAGKITYYNLANFPSDKWQSFFPEDSEIPEFMSNLPSTGKLPPQLGLFMAFIKMMDMLKADINQLSTKHLDFYFEKVLRFVRQKAIAEKANIVFDPAPNITEPIVLPSGLELLAGKDENGEPIIFNTDKEFTVSKAAIAKVSSVLVDKTNQSRAYAAPMADSGDGIGGPLPKDVPYWNPFGETQSDKSVGDRTMIDGKMGFALASAMLLLKEGKRKITVVFQCRNYRFINIHFDAMRTDGISPAVIDLMQPVAGIFYNSMEEMLEAITNAIGTANFTANQAIILDYINHPFKLVKDEDFEQAFEVEATGEKDWFSIPEVLISKQLDRDLRFQMQLGITDPGIVDYNVLTHKQPINTTLPIIQFNLNHEAGNYIYEQLRGLKIVNIQIDVDVKGVKTLVLQSENGPINPTQPFLPFGAVPTEGTHFHFGSREVFSKKLTSLEIEWSWANLPKDAHGFQDYYKDYTVIPNNESFEAFVSILDQKAWIPTLPIKLFKTETVGVPPGDLPLVRGIYTVNIVLPLLHQTPLPEINSFDPELTAGFARLTLKDRDFGHSIFPKEYADKALAKVTDPTVDLPNPPYTPKINHFAVNYAASMAFVPSDTINGGGDQVFHVEPLGLTPMNEDTSADLFPQFAQGTFYIGLANLIPPQNISILFQMVDGSANPDIEVTREDVKWSYFDKTRWKYFSDDSIPLDTTFGLQTSGIIEFSIGNDASDKAAFWANGLFWIRAEFLKDVSGSSKVAGILSNAMVATLRHDLVDTGVLRQSLEAGTINKLFVTDPRIKVVNQPFSSFGGKPVEPKIDFNRRVSDRLRHKNRAVNVWDYEHIILEAFPSIYKVKCLPHTNRSIEPAPGSVTLLVIPDLRRRNKINPFEPKVSAVLRARIADYIANLSSGVATVFVDNPTYEQVFVEMSVGLRAGYDGNFYGRLLNEELKRFLSPWAFEEGKDIVFGGKIFKSSILFFVEQREYVDYVTNFKLFHVSGGPGIGDMRVREDLFTTPQDFIVRANTVGEEADFEIVASSPKSILVTAQQHNITVLNPGEFACPGNSLGTGIGAMIIEVDFFVF